ncbi:MAG: hypothetical protein KAG61_03485 [Bacteriovoracaceae bacterium]|nr:hypothetical protein [Bacteriovoracaceae bacterium]
MKNLIAFITVLVSLNAFATDYGQYGECSGVFTQALWEITDGEGVDVLYETTAQMTEKEFNSTPVFNDGFEYQSCKDSVREFAFMDMEGNEFKIMYTNEENCDGGNSYGVIVDMNSSKIIAHINDSDISCL